MISRPTGQQCETATTTIMSTTTISSNTTMLTTVPNTGANPTSCTDEEFWPTYNKVMFSTWLSTLGHALDVDVSLAKDLSVVFCNFSNWFNHIKYMLVF